MVLAKDELDWIYDGLPTKVKQVVDHAVSLARPGRCADALQDFYLGYWRETGKFDSDLTNAMREYSESPARFREGLLLWLDWRVNPPSDGRFRNLCTIQ